KLDQSAAKFQLSHDLMRQTSDRFALAKAKLAWFEIHHTQRAESIPLAGDQRHATIEFKIWFTRDRGDFIEALVFPEIRCNNHLRATDRRRAKRNFARTLVEVWR